jgi:hypothetical protein
MGKCVTVYACAYTERAEKQRPLTANRREGYEYEVENPRLPAMSTAENANQTGNRRKPQRLAPKEAEIIAALQASHGILSPAAKALGLARSSLDRMVQRRSRLAYACRQAREGLVDYAETRLFEKIKDGDSRCIIFALSSPIARARGWGSSGDVNGETRQITEIVIKVVDAVEGRPVGPLIEHEAIAVPDKDADEDDEIV